MSGILKAQTALLLALAVLCPPGQALAQDAWWPALKKELWENNPKLAAGRKKAEAADKIPDSKMALADPMISAGIMSVPTDSFRLDQEEMTQKFVEFRQDVPAFSMRAANRRMAQAAAGAARAELAMDAAMAAMELKMAVNEVIFTRRARAILDDTGSLLDKLAQTTLAKYASGKDAQTNAILAQLESGKLQRQKLKLEERMELARIKINRLLGRDQAAPFPAPGEYAPGAADGAGMADAEEMRRAPAVAMAQAMAREAEAAVEEAEASTAIMWTFSASYGQRDPSPDMPRPGLINVMAGATIPLYKSGKQAKVIAAARLAAMEKKDRLRDAELETRARIASSRASLAQEERMIALYDTGLIPQAALAAESAVAAYQLDRGEFSMALMNQMSLLDIRMDLEMSRMRRADLSAALEAQTGAGNMEE